MFMCVYIYICVCMYVCICIYICMITGQPVMYRDPWGPLLGFMMGAEVFKRHPFGICLVFRAYMKFQLNHRTYYRCGVLLDSWSTRSHESILVVAGSLHVEQASLGQEEVTRNVLLQTSAFGHPESKDLSPSECGYTLESSSRKRFGPQGVQRSTVQARHTLSAWYTYREREREKDRKKEREKAREWDIAHMYTYIYMYTHTLVCYMYLCCGFCIICLFMESCFDLSSNTFWLIQRLRKSICGHTLATSWMSRTIRFRPDGRTWGRSARQVGQLQTSHLECQISLAHVLLVDMVTT